MAAAFSAVRRLAGSGLLQIESLLCECQPARRGPWRPPPPGTLGQESRCPKSLAPVTVRPHGDHSTQQPTRKRILRVFLWFGLRLPPGCEFPRPGYSGSLPSSLRSSDRQSSHPPDGSRHRSPRPLAERWSALDPTRCALHRLSNSKLRRCELAALFLHHSI